MGRVRDYAELGQRIREVRLDRGLDQGQLARRAGLERTALSRVESGKRKVSALELDRLAEGLDVALADLVVLPAVDVRAARRPLEDHASATEQAGFAADLDLDRALRDLQQLRGVGLLGPVGHGLGGGGLSSEDEARRLAREARAFLGRGDDPLGPVSDEAARLGLWCRTTRAAVDGRSLTPEPGFGVAVVGAHLDPGRRRMTAAHELGHHLAGDTYEVAGHDTAPGQTERWVDAFAAELLLPEAVVKGPADRDTLVEIAARYRVSWSVVVTTAQRADLDLAGIRRHETPTDTDFLRLVGEKPQPDLEPPGLAREWVKACAQAAADHRVTWRRAAEMSLGLVEVPQ